MRESAHSQRFLALSGVPARSTVGEESGSVCPRRPSLLNFAAPEPTMQSVSQVSPPLRIALGGALAFLALWFVALKPKPPADVPPAPAPTGAQSAPGKAVEQAQQAAGAKPADPAAASAPQAAAAEPAPAASAKPAAKPSAPVDVKKAAGDEIARPADAVLRDVAKGKVAIVLFWDRRVSDDRAVRRAVSDLSRRGGKVAIHTAAMKRLADYEVITRGVPIVTSPTVMVIDRARRARTVSGLTVTSELEDVVDKAIRVRP